MDRKLTFAFYGRDVSAGRTMTGLAGKTDTLSSRTHSAAKSVLALGAGYLSLQGGVNLIKNSISAASDQAESLSKTHVVFGRYSKDFEKFASTSATTMGQSNQQTLEYGATLGNLFTAMEVGQRPAERMSKNLLTLAGDLASFNNADPSDVLEAIRSGLVGETEPMRRFGVNISAVAVQAEALSSGLVKAQVDSNDLSKASLANAEAQQKLNEVNADGNATALDRRRAVVAVHDAEAKLAEVMAGKVPELTAAQKAQAAYNLMLKQTGTAQGDFARTSGGLANQQRILSAQWADMKVEIGQKLMPVALDLTHWMTEDAMPALEELGGWVRDNKTQLEWFAGIVGGLAVGFKAFKGVRSIQALVGKGPLAGGGLGGAASMAKPIPVFVTNPGGLPGVGGKGTPPVVGAPSGAGKIGGGGVGGFLKSIPLYGVGAQSDLKSMSHSAQETAEMFNKLYGAQLQTREGWEKLRNALGFYKQQAENATGADKEAADALYAAARAAVASKASIYGAAASAKALTSESRISAGAVRDLRAAMHEAASDAKRLGGDIIGGLIQGIHDRIPELQQEAKYVAATTIKHLRSDQAFDTDSPSKKTHKIGQDVAAGLWTGWLDYKPWDKLAASTRQGLRGLSNLAQAAVGYKAGIRQGVQTDVAQAVGSGVGTVTYLHAQRNDLRKFAHVYNQLRRKGLSESLLSQFAEAGPAALPAMESLLHGGIREANQTQRQIDRLGKRFANQATEDRYGKRIADSLDDLPREMARELVRELRRHGIHVAADSGQEAHRRRRAG